MTNCCRDPFPRIIDVALTVAGSRASLNTIWIVGCTDTEVAPGLGKVETTVGAVESFASVTLAEALRVVSAWLTAVIVTVPVGGIATGGLYIPVALMIPKVLSPPTVPLTSQFAAVFVTPVTVAVNCCGWNNCTVAVSGETAIPSFTAMEEFADLVGSAVLVAVKVTVAGLGTVVGAVNSPEEDITPALPFPPAVLLIDQVTVWLGLLVP